MKKFDYAYFTIYNYCTHTSYFPDSILVRMKCMYLLALSAGGWLLLLQQLFLRYVRVEWFATQEGAFINAISMYALVTFAFYRIFIVEGRDQKIFDKHATNWQNNPNKRRDLLIISFIAAMPYMLMICGRIFLPR